MAFMFRRGWNRMRNACWSSSAPRLKARRNWSASPTAYVKVHNRGRNCSWTSSGEDYRWDPSWRLPMARLGSRKPWKKLATHARSALLGAQNRQRSQQAAEEPANQGKAGIARNLDGGDQEGCTCGV